ncbi:MAG TPA: alkaline phosphatase family protein [Ktedonobacteraceae bacterium]|nr:alkaline phosphatase family protein [Ktedonobacteraceae bacterium]
MSNHSESKRRLAIANVLVAAISITMLLTVFLGPKTLHVLGNGTKKHFSASILPPIKTVFLVVMENKNWSSIFGNTSAPYINNTLLPMASYATQYYDPPNNHPSLPNYLWLEAGTNFGITKDGMPSQYHQNTTNHFVTLLQNANYSWKAYVEGITGTVCPLTTKGLYTPRHNAPLYFDDVTNINNPKSMNCIAHERPYQELAGDLQNNTVSNFNYIEPNLCDDMHGAKGCQTSTNSEVQHGDTWLSQSVPQILNSQAYKTGGALFITWDEGQSVNQSKGDGPLGMIVLSPFAKGLGYSNSIHYTHSSTLLTLEEIFGLAPLLGDAVNATDLSDLFVAPSYSVSGTVMACSSGSPPTCNSPAPFTDATLQLLNSSGATVTTTTSDPSTGNYSFAGLVPGNYTVNISGTFNNVSYSSTDPLDVTGNATGVILDAYPAPPST